MDIRTNLSERDVIQNMLELVGFLEQKNTNQINVEVEGLHMHFKAWNEEEE